MIAGLAIGFSLAVLAACGLVAMAMYVSATEKDRHCQEECIPEDVAPQRLR